MSMLVKIVTGSARFHAAEKIRIGGAKKGTLPSEPVMRSARVRKEAPLFCSVPYAMA